ncbi:winged helix-turn-helix domain-containing protein [Vibrio azureus]|uniref:OmpR/PhoB-type domain-containing protein n=2 Tax=Vibrio azureus TaxID=512649 RepID=U3AD40_9VIBR|nr:helix-turn-helix domain-containing protein [Vibrio azureus]GAD77816.1 hypothetical protein VAZ01S_094_00080 [Vibrio azureus NBRC 104587]
MNMREKHSDYIEISFGSSTLKRDENGAYIILNNGKSISITIPESYILHKLIKQKNELVYRDELVIDAWGSIDIIGPNSLPVAITNLRKILDFDNIKIVNIPKQGYMIKLPEPKIVTEVQLDEDELEALSEINTLNIDRRSPNHYSIYKTKRLYLTLFIFLSCLYIIFYLALSWISLGCQSVGNNSICFIDGENIDINNDIFSSLTDGSYYSARSGLIQINEKADEK